MKTGGVAQPHDHNSILRGLLQLLVGSLEQDEREVHDTVSIKVARHGGFELKILPGAGCPARPLPSRRTERAYQVARVVVECRESHGWRLGGALCGGRLHGREDLRRRAHPRPAGQEPKKPRGDSGVHDKETPHATLPFPRGMQRITGCWLTCWREGAPSCVCARRPPGRLKTSSRGLHGDEQARDGRASVTTPELQGIQTAPAYVYSGHGPL